MRIVLADNQAPRSAELRRMLLGEGLTCEADDVVSFDGLPGRLAGAGTDLVLVVLDGSSDASLEAVRTAHQITDAPVLAAGQGATVGTIRETMRAGAREFLDLGRLREELSETLIKIEAEGGITSRRGTLISLYSPSGGVGVSTTAVNLAARLAADKAGQVALLDLKPAPSDLSLLLDIEPEHTTGEVCGAWQRLDRKMLEGAVTRHRSGVHVLAQAGFPDDGTMPPNTLTKEAIRQICTIARAGYAATVADLPHTLEVPVVEAMRLSSLIGLIARPDVPGLRRARWALDAAAAAGVPRDRFRLVLNRFGQSGQVGLDQVETILGINVFQRIPEDGRAVNRAVNQGVPLAEVSKLSRISRSFSSFARSVQTSS